MKKLLAKTDKKLLIITIILALFGLLMIFSASSAKAAVYGNPYSVFIKHAITLAICMLGSVIIISIPTNTYQKFINLALYIIILALIFIFTYGVVINSTKRWIDFGFYNFQPSEFAKVILIVYLGTYYAKYQKDNSYLVLLKPLLYGALICFLIFMQPDFGTMFIIFSMMSFIFLSLPINKKIKNKIIQIAFGALLISFLFFLSNGQQFFKTGQADRFKFLNPCQRYKEKSGYQVCNGFIAINNGGLWGVGLGNSTQKFLYLPAAYTDFIFPVIVEELGLLVGLLIILLYIFILYRIFRIAKRSYNLRGAIIAYGIGVYILLHIVINLAGVLGIMPLTGVPLPFLSYGGSYIFNLTIALAIVQRIEIENNTYRRRNLLK